MKLIIFILIVLIIAALLIRIILRSVNQHSPLLMQLHAAGIRTGDAERILSGGEYWQRQKTLLTEREVSFMKVNRPGFPGECFICELRLP
ncbi:hypothetical protein HEM41_023815, partial [Escherichia coli]|nr:hypothetical protein [Escherichia coli]